MPPRSCKPRCQPGACARCDAASAYGTTWYQSKIAHDPEYGRKQYKRRHRCARPNLCDLCETRRKSNAAHAQESRRQALDADPDYHKNLYAKHRDTILKNVRKRRAAQPEKERAYNRKYTRSRSGNPHTDDSLAAAILAQQNTCPGCLRSFAARLKPYADHCHSTGQARGALCCWCNFHLGILEHPSKERLDRIARLQLYAAEWSAKALAR